MHLTARTARTARAARRAAHARLAAQDGFTMVAVLGVLVAAMALAAAAFAAAGGDVHLSRNDEDQKRAYAAAEAGVQDYFFHLTQNNAYWAQCQTTARTVPGSTTSYAVVPVPANGARACSTSDAQGTMIVASGPQSGTFSVRSTGTSGNVRRTIVASFRRRSFLDYLYFTDLETTDPVWYALNANGNPTRSGNRSGRNGNYTYVWSGPDSDLTRWATDSCLRYYRTGRGDQSYPTGGDDVWEQQVNGVWDPGTIRTSSVGCGEIQFASGDAIHGPMHTNDEFYACSPQLGERPTDAIEVSGSRIRSSCTGGDPDIEGTWKPFAPVLTLPPSDTSLRNEADGAYVFHGTTWIVLNGSTMSVTNANLGASAVTMALPPDGVVYVDHDRTTGCAVAAYRPLNPYGDPAGCGNVYVRGSYAQDLTIGAAKDIVVNGDVTRSGDPMLGLVATNFVRVYHPVRNRSGTSCSNDTGTMSSVEIDAAILALNHSFTVDNYYCGAALGRLTVNGTIAQRFRGPVGVGSGSSLQNGYLKDYWYDERLRLREPPHFLDPVQSAWRLQRYAEQVGAS